MIWIILMLGFAGVAVAGPWAFATLWAKRWFKIAYWVAVLLAVLAAGNHHIGPP